MKKYDGHKLCAKSSFDRFSCTILSRKFNILAIPNLLAHARKFKILAIPNVLAQGKSTVSQKNATMINSTQSRARSRVRSIFHAISWKFKILAIPNVLTNGKSYKHDFTKKCDGHKLFSQLRAKSEFRSVFRAPSQKF
ncbi:hypothetical protein B296_00040353 [Ensete ventricosum]|uniref:Uncharacterized protein n=1 Tax=Ensete ventricosum TaxID=4639 RepID=A0A426ZL10_ENSVE|nr:hypothetical protein B296_00040353 [Ensete ventricosum]